MDIIKKYSEHVKQGIKTTLENYSKELRDQPWKKDVIDRLTEFSTKGKAFRGSLLLHSYELFSGSEGKSTDEGVLSIAVALELIHTSFLIHDDIIDRDDLRRGVKTIHAQYSELGRQEKVNEEDIAHFGTSMGICVADFGYFLAYDILGKSLLPDGVKGKVISAISHELAQVCLAEMEDSHLGITKKRASTADILQMYEFKTARYTLGLPLIIGAMVAGQTSERVKQIEEFAVHAGLLFQLKDDELSLFGNTEQMGKKQGNDLAEGKQTPFLTLLFETATGEEKKRLISWLEQPTPENQQHILDLMQAHHIPEKVNEKKAKLKKDALRILDSSELDSEQKQGLGSLLELIDKRVK